MSNEQTVPVAHRAAASAAELAIGQVIAQTVVVFDRARLVRYAGASGDFNPIHWNERVATSVDLPGVIAHGMLTMGAVVGVVGQWAGDPGAIADYRTRFSRPVPVPDGDDARVSVTATVGAIDAVANTARIDIAAVLEDGSEKGVAVLTRAQAVVRLA